MTCYVYDMFLLLADFLIVNETKTEATATTIGNYIHLHMVSMNMLVVI